MLRIEVLKLISGPLRSSRHASLQPATAIAQIVTSYLTEVLAGHIGKHAVEILLVLLVDESVVEHAQCLVAEEAEDLFRVPNVAGVRLKNTCGQSHKV